MSNVQMPDMLNTSNKKEKVNIIIHCAAEKQDEKNLNIILEKIQQNKNLKLVPGLIFEM